MKFWEKKFFLSFCEFLKEIFESNVMQPASCIDNVIYQNINIPSYSN